MRKGLIALAGICLCIFTGFSQNDIVLTPVANGFDVPVGMAHANDDRLFIVEKDGYIRIMDTTGQITSLPFLDIDTKVNSGASERGLLGLAFHPDYANNRYFFVNYSNNGGNTVIARYQTDAGNPDHADAGTEEILMTVSQPFANHNGGDIKFGPDGYLYIGLGDGGSGGDPGNRSQNGMELLGKMLRIDVNTDTLYGIPPDNPYSASLSVRNEIWAFGLRNPWRYAFDRVTGDLWIADVGQDEWEEVSFQPANSTGGENYGWRCKEGLENFNTSGCPDDDQLVAPVTVYAHTGASCSGSITGGYIYRGTKQTYLDGKYVYADYCTGVFRAVWFDQLGEVQTEQLGDFQNQQFVTFGEDASGELYVAAASGTIYRIEDLISGTREATKKKFSIAPNPASQTFQFEGDADLKIDYQVNDLHGRRISSGTAFAGQTIDCSGFVEGTYLVELRYAGGKETGRLVIVR